ncbi:hypothetical protein BJX70DRAFT_366295 [Aspergillus crustosus]
MCVLDDTSHFNNTVRRHPATDSKRLGGLWRQSPPYEAGKGPRNLPEVLNLIWRIWDLELLMKFAARLRFTRSVPFLPKAKLAEYCLAHDNILPKAYSPPGP